MKTQDEDHNELLRLAKAAVIALAVIVITLLVYAKWTYADYTEWKRWAEISVSTRFPFKTLDKAFLKFDECYGNPVYAISNIAEWAGCELQAAIVASDSGNSAAFAEYVQRREEAVELAGVRQYPMQAEYRGAPLR